MLARCGLGSTTLWSPRKQHRTANPCEPPVASPRTGPSGSTRPLPDGPLLVDEEVVGDVRPPFLRTVVVCTWLPGSDLLAALTVGVSGCGGQEEPDVPSRQPVREASGRCRPRPPAAGPGGESRAGSASPDEPRIALTANLAPEAAACAWAASARVANSPWMTTQYPGLSPGVTSGR